MIRAIFVPTVDGNYRNAAAPVGDFFFLIADTPVH